MTISKTWSAVLVTNVALIVCLLSASSDPAVRVEPMDSVGPRLVEQQTQASVVRDYLQAWRTLRQAMASNQADLLNAYFVGRAKDTLADTIRDQRKLGIASEYQDTSHDIRVVFYSPEGLSIELLDDVEYDVAIHDSGNSLGMQHVHTRFVIVLTPAESQWKVRVFQGGAS